MRHFWQHRLHRVYSVYSACLIDELVDRSPPPDEYPGEGAKAAGVAHVPSIGHGHGGANWSVLLPAGTCRPRPTGCSTELRVLRVFTAWPDIRPGTRDGPILIWFYWCMNGLVTYSASPDTQSIFQLVSWSRLFTKSIRYRGQFLSNIYLMLLPRVPTTKFLRYMRSIHVKKTTIIKIYFLRSVPVLIWTF